MTDWRTSMYRTSFHWVFSHLVFRFASLLSFCPLSTPGAMFPGRDGHDECHCLDTGLFTIHYTPYRLWMSLFGHWTIQNTLYTLQMMNVTVWTLNYSLYTIQSTYDECHSLDTGLYRIRYILYKWWISLFGHWTILYIYVHYRIQLNFIYLH